MIFQDITTLTGKLLHAIDAIAVTPYCLDDKSFVIYIYSFWIMLHLHYKRNKIALNIYSDIIQFKYNNKSKAYEKKE